MLPVLQEKYGLYLLTDELRAIQERKLQCLGLEHVFLKTVSAQEIGSTKPSEKCYRYITEIIGESVENILVVGDNPGADIRGGNLAGMQAGQIPLLSAGTGGKAGYCFYQLLTIAGENRSVGAEAPFSGRKKRRKAFLKFWW